MSTLTQALQEIDHWIHNSDSWHAKRIRGADFSPEFQKANQDKILRPGLEREMIDLFATEYDFQFSEEVYELYQWHDGGFTIGDLSNLVQFTPLENAVEFIVHDDIPYRSYMPLFLGDQAYFTVPEATGDKRSSPLFFYDGYGQARHPNIPQRYLANLCPEHYAPSLTALMQAIAECARTHDGISTEYMLMDHDPQEIYTHQWGRHQSILTPIYRKYGVTGDSAGLWR